MNNSLTKSEPVEDTTAKDDGEIHSGVGVLDKTVKILDALESGPLHCNATVSYCATSMADSYSAPVSPNLPPQQARIVC